MHILSIQSSVARGFVGNRTAVFVLQRLGHRVTCIDTVAYSNHPAHGGFRGGVHPAESIDRIVSGLEERGFLEDIDLVLSGYLGSAANAEAVGRTVDRVGAPYLLDPVMGDDPKGLFVAPDLPDAIRRELLPRAAAATPNRFELSLLGDREVDGPARAAEVAAGLGPPSSWQRACRRGRGGPPASACRRARPGWPRCRASRIRVTGRATCSPRCSRPGGGKAGRRPWRSPPARCTPP